MGNAKGIFAADGYEIIQAKPLPIVLKLLKGFSFLIGVGARRTEDRTASRQDTDDRIVRKRLDLARD
jgi:hypothetical protein